MPFRLILLAFGLIFTFQVAAQEQLSSSNGRAVKAYQEGLEAIRARDYNGGIALFQKAVDRDDQFWEAHYQLGSALRVMFDTTRAVSHWERVVELGTDDKKVAAVHFLLGDYYHSHGQYDEAEANFEALLAGAGASQKQKEQAQHALKSIAFVRHAMANPVEFDPRPLPRVLNNYSLQYFPVMTADFSAFFFTRRETPGDTDDEDIFVSRRMSDNTWSYPESVSSVVNTEHLNEGTCTVSADGRMLIFTSCGRPGGQGSCDLYVTYKVGESWTTPQNLGNRVNSSNWESHPALSADGRLLFFSAIRGGGYGKKDIWVSKLQADGTWGYPQNLGPKVNTAEDELSPFIHVNGQTLYFSSNGHIGMGGFDLFKSELEPAGWGEPQNLGYPLNDRADQSALFITSDGARGYFSKDFNSRSRNARSLLYTFELPPSAQADITSTYIFGKVYHADTKRPLGATLELMGLENDTLLGQVRSDPITGDYLIVLNEGMEYGLFAESKGFLYQSLTFNYTAVPNPKPIRLDLYLDPLVVGRSMILKNVFFDTDSYMLRDKSKTELKRAVSLMLDNPTINVEIGGHTDDVGSEAYNQTLSTNRAKAVYDFLIKSGIPENRLRFRGYGESKPSVANDSEENRQLNRRIEFVIYR